MPLLDLNDIYDLRGVEAEAFMHTYTRVAASVGAENPWHVPTLVPGTPVTGVLCSLQFTETAVHGDTGIVTVREPELFIAYNDTLKVGDTVRDITTILLPTIILSGDYQVLNVEPMADAGLIMKRARLHGARVFNAGD